MAEYNFTEYEKMTDNFASFEDVVGGGDHQAANQETTVGEKRRERSRSPLRRSKRFRDSSESDRQKIRMVVSNIPFDVRWQEIKDLYKQKVCEDGCFAEIILSADGKSSGSAIVEVIGREKANKAIAVLNECELKGRKLNVREEKEQREFRHGGRQNAGGATNMMQAPVPNMKYDSLPPGCRHILAKLNIDPDCITNQVFIANLDYKVHVKKITELFQMAGNILQAEIKLDKDGKSRGLARVRYENPIEAVQAISMFNGQVLFERKMDVRMDRMSESTHQFIPNKIPTGINGIGPGLGENGQPLMNIGQIANFITLNNLANLIPGSGPGSGSMIGGGMMGGGNMGLGAMNGLQALLAALSGGSLNNVLGGGMMGNAGPGIGGGGNPGMGGMFGNGNNMGSPTQAMFGGNSMSGSMGGNVNNSSSGMFGGSNMGNNASNSNPGMFGGNMNIKSESGGPVMFGGGGNTNSGNPPPPMGFPMGGGGAQRQFSGGHKSDQPRLIVKNLPFNVSWQKLKDKFKEIGEVKYAEIKVENGKSKGFGYVRFAKQEDSRRAVELLNGVMFDNRRIEVMFE